MGFWYESAPGVSLGCRSTKAPWYRPVITQVHANLPACFTTKISCLLPPQQQGPQAHHETCAPVSFRYESTPGGHMSPHMPPYGHRVGFVCMGGTPQLGCLGQQGGTWGTPHTPKTNPMAIGGHLWAYITPRGRLIPKPHKGGEGVGCFISLRAQSGPHHGDF